MNGTIDSDIQFIAIDPSLPNLCLRILDTSSWKVRRTTRLPECSELVVAIVVAVVWLVATHTLYTLHYHPLSRFPGPKLWILSRLPYMRAMQRGTLVHQIQAFHSSYGEVVRIGPNELSFTNPQAWADIYGSHAKEGLPTFPKNPLWISRGKSNYNAASILSANDMDHHRIRRLISPAFSDKALREQEPILQEYIGVLMRRLQSQIHAGWGCGVVDLVDWYSWTTFDIVGELGFGETFGCLSSPMHHDWSAMVFSHFRASALVTSVKFYPYLENVLRWFLPRDVSNRQNHFQKSREKVHRRLRDANTTKVDFMSYVLDQKLEERMSLKEIETTFNILVIAGSETTASALVGTTGFLLRNPACMATLVKEIRGAFDEEKDITLAAVGRLSYLSAVIEEGLRMGPPVPSGLPRVVPAAGAYVCDKWIPGGTNISLNQWAAYRSPTNFSRPNEFLPERWLSSVKASSPFSDDRKSALQPFSFGPRNCIGKNLAYAELRLILARMIWNFDFSPAGTREEQEAHAWEQQKTFVLVEKLPLKVQLRAAKR